MRNLRILFLFIVAAAMATSCVSKKRFLKMQAHRQQCDEKLQATEARAMWLESDTTEWGVKYRALLKEMSFLEESSTSEKQYLSGELSSKESQLRNKEKLLLEREKKLQELQEVIARQEQAVADLRNKVAGALVGFKGDELSIEMKNGKVYVSLAEKLLFKSGSATVDPKGKEALNKLAVVLEKNPDIDIMIEGHTDNVPLIAGRFADNWDLSAARALSIVRILTQDNKVEPTRVTAAGRGEFTPVASNETAEGKARNRRTEIILSPKLDELFKILEAK